MFRRSQVMAFRAAAAHSPAGRNTQIVRQVTDWHVSRVIGGLVSVYVVLLGGFGLLWRRIGGRTAELQADIKELGADIQVALAALRTPRGGR